MGTLAHYLQEAIASELPSRWKPCVEGRILSPAIAARYGFSPCADLLLQTGSRRVVVELEISRADPVANHVKFLIARDAGELTDEDIFVSMMSPHIVPGRRNVGAAFTRHMRTEGHQAFQVSLLPTIAPSEIARLNHSELPVIDRRGLPIQAESARLISVLEPLGERKHRIHFAGDVADVIANLWTWNSDVGVSAWGRRRVQYFVYDPLSGNFAPSKFCAFIPATLGAEPPPPTMSFEIYASLGERDPRFDGHVARKHLTQRLAFREVALTGVLERRFIGWMAQSGRAILLRPPVRALLPPAWYAPSEIESEAAL